MQLRNEINYKPFLFIICFALPLASFGHTINYVLERAPVNEVVWFYFKLGITHIVPLGYDHILFVISLCLLYSEFKTILWQTTPFTLAHTIILAISLQGMTTLPADIVE